MKAETDCRCRCLAEPFADGEAVLDALDHVCFETRILSWLSWAGTQMPSDDGCAKTIAAVYHAGRLAGSLAAGDNSVVEELLAAHEAAPHQDRFTLPDGRHALTGGPLLWPVRVGFFRRLVLVLREWVEGEPSPELADVIRLDVKALRPEAERRHTDRPPSLDFVRGLWTDCYGLPPTPGTARWVRWVLYGLHDTPEPPKGPTQGVLVTSFMLTAHREHIEGIGALTRKDAGDDIAHSLAYSSPWTTDEQKRSAIKAAQRHVRWWKKVVLKAVNDGNLAHPDARRLNGAKPNDPEMYADIAAGLDRSEIIQQAKDRQSSYAEKQAAGQRAKDAIRRKKSAG